MPPAEGEGPWGNPLTHRLLQATGPGATARVRRALFARPLRLFPHNLDQAARTTAALSRPRSPLPRTEPRDPEQPACAVRLRAGAGLRACVRLSAARRRGCREAESPNVLPRVNALGKKAAALAPSGSLRTRFAVSKSKDR